MFIKLPPFSFAFIGQDLGSQCSTSGAYITFTAAAIKYLLRPVEC